jgi:DNA-directed RNA polymerase specialized sigma24 family protein
MSDVTRILSQIEQGDRQAAEKLLPLVYDELRQLARQKLAQEQPGHTLQPTALVHEVYLRLIGGPGVRSQGPGVSEELKKQNLAPDPCPLTPAFDSRGHFFAAAATAMRRILVENARRKSRLKHGGQFEREELADIAQPDDDERLLALDEALTRLAAEDSKAAQVVELHHFAGLSHDQVSRAMEITIYEARQKWTYARAWLQSALAEN